LDISSEAQAATPYAVAFARFVTELAGLLMHVAQAQRQQISTMLGCRGKS